MSALPTTCYCLSSPHPKNGAHLQNLWVCRLQCWGRHFLWGPWGVLGHKWWPETTTCSQACTDTLQALRLVHFPLERMLPTFWVLNALILSSCSYFLCLSIAVLPLPALIPHLQHFSFASMQQNFFLTACFSVFCSSVAMSVSPTSFNKLYFSPPGEFFKIIQ